VTQVNAKLSTVRAYCQNIRRLQCTALYSQDAGPLIQRHCTIAHGTFCMFLLLNVQGNAVVNSEADVAAAWQKLGGKELYAEKWVPFVKELAVMVM
jgi:ATP-grasp domain